MPRSRQRKGNGPKGECRTDALGFEPASMPIPRWERTKSAVGFSLGTDITVLSAKLRHGSSPLRCAS
jgi:hypothetical protein